MGHTEGGTHLLVETIRRLYDYTDWANERLFAAAAGVPAETARGLQQGHDRTLLETLIHMLDAHRGWLSWWDGTATTTEAREKLRLDPAVVTDVDAVREAWTGVRAQTERFVGTLTEEQLATTYHRELRDGHHFAQPLWAMMVHVVNHGTQHRTEAAEMCTAVGCSPGELDFLWYFGG